MSDFPYDLLDTPQWGVYKLEQRDGKTTKVPHSPITRQRASSTDATDWSSYKQAVTRLEQGSYDGLGFVFTERDSFAGVDIDDAFDADGNLKPAAQAIVDSLNSYTERSPSGHGLHIIMKGVEPQPAAKKPYNGLKSVEAYSKERYFTMTGDHLPGSPTTVEDRGEEFTALRILIQPVPSETVAVFDWPSRAIDPLFDDELIEKARKAKNGDKFSRLFDQGEASDYDHDVSSASLALCCMLAFYAGPNGHGQVDRIFRRSELMRPKWDSKRSDSTWGHNTVLKAYEDRTEFFHSSDLELSLSGAAIATGKDDPFAAPKLLRCSELPAAERQPRYWFGLYPGKVSFIVGETGAGKSSLLYNLVLNAAIGEALWNIPFDHLLRVLYVDPENGGNLTSTKIERIGHGKPDGLYFSDGLGVNLMRQAHRESLKRSIEANGFDLVILDPIANLFHTKDENANAEAAEQMKFLTGLSRETGACIVAVHHTGKDASGGIYGRGASARLAAADVGLVLRYTGDGDDQDDTFSLEAEHQRDDFCRLQIVKNRLEGKGSLYLQMAGNDRFNLSTHAAWKSRKAGTTFELKANRAEEEILLYTADGQWYAKQDIINKMRAEDIGETNVTKALTALVESGKLEKKKGDKNALAYRLAQEVEPA